MLPIVSLYTNRIGKLTTNPRTFFSFKILKFLFFINTRELFVPHVYESAIVMDLLDHAIDLDQCLEAG